MKLEFRRVVRDSVETLKQCGAQSPRCPNLAARVDTIRGTPRNPLPGVRGVNPSGIFDLARQLAASDVQ